MRRSLTFFALVLAIALSVSGCDNPFSSTTPKNCVARAGDPLVLPSVGPFLVQFFDESSDACHQDGRLWRFGDGLTSTEATPVRVAEVHLPLLRQTTRT